MVRCNALPPTQRSLNSFLNTTHQVEAAGVAGWGRRPMCRAARGTIGVSRSLSVAATGARTLAGRDAGGLIARRQRCHAARTFLAVSASRRIRPPTTNSDRERVLLGKGV